MANFEIHFKPGTERQALRKFVQETLLFMHESLTLFQKFFYQDLAEGMNQAFEEFLDRHGDLPTAVLEMEPSVLKAHALTGANLQFKLNIVHFHHQNFENAQARGIKTNLFRKVFKAINPLLKSTVSSLPGGGALVELKECFENSIKD